MGAKFFVFAGRRWRELDTEDGSLEGWGRARFVYYRRGQLNMARRGAVLRALRALGTGCGVAARDGLPLSKYEPLPLVNNRQQNLHACFSCQPRHLCAQCSNDAKFDRLLRPGTSEAAVQCVATANAEVQVTLATQSQPQAKDGSQNRRRAVTESKPVRDEGHNRGRAFTESKPVRDEGQNRGRPVTESKPVRDEGQNRRRAVTESKRVVDKITPDNRRTQGQRGRKRKRRSSSDSSKDSSDEGRSPFKELVIEESDVELLQRFLRRDPSGLLHVDVDVDRFVADEDYKERVFYGINPLVTVERCPRIALMLSEKRNRMRDSDLSLRQFMKVLGLKTVGEESPAKRYKTRSSMNNDKENAVKGNGEIGPVRSAKRTAKVLREDNASQREPHAKRPKSSPQKVVSKEVVEISSEDEFLVPKAPMPIRQTRLVKQDNVVSSSGGRGGSINSKDGGSGNNNSKDSGSGRMRLVKENNAVSSSGGNNNSGSGRIGLVKGDNAVNSSNSKTGGSGRGSSGGGSSRGGNGREYTAEEDAAIVSWVARGTRARSVNGNRLWREMQRHHQETTGTVRSWHSLRNRYLRYILPALPKLTNSQDAMRLRAAAATGELKSRKRPQKENSLLVLPRVRSAWSRRRPTPTRSPTRSPTTTRSPTPTLRPTRRNASTPISTEKPSERRRTPRFSELARRFADRPGSSGDSAPSPPLRRSTRNSIAPPQPPEGPHRRRLYNNQAVL